MQLHRFSTTIELNIDSLSEAESGIVSDVVVGAGFEVGRFVFCIRLQG
jgi:myo-inositol-hexaphosphate 3-phosphohydrolase